MKKVLSTTALIAILTGTAYAAGEPAPDQDTKPPPRIEITLTPTLADGHATGIDVAYTLLAQPQAQLLSLQWDLLGPTPGRSSDQVQNLTVSDEHGNLAMTATLDRDNGVQIYTSDRIPSSKISVTYHIPVALPKPKAGRGPHREMQAAGGGISTSGDGIFLLPALAGPVALHLHWINPTGFSGTSSFGDADIRLTRDIDQIRNGFYLTGPLIQFSAHTSNSLFSARGLGNNDIDLKGLFEWSSRAYEATRQAFDGPRTKPFRLFYRSYDGGSLDSGRADQNGILLYIAPHHDDPHTTTDLEHLIAHEMIHVWQPDIVDDIDTAWFTEGSADYLASILTFQQHLMTQADYVRLINLMATQYYGNARRNIPNSAIQAAMTSASDAWLLPYNRGFMYFADLDARVRQHNSGRVTVMTLFKEFGALHLQGLKQDTKAWRSIAIKYAGPAAGEALDAMLSGSTIIPFKGAFGPCVKPKNITIGTFNLGFSKAEHGNSIVAVTPNSNAQQAGLLVGDKLAGNMDLDAFYGDSNRTLNLPIKRDGQSMIISYKPRNGSVAAVAWYPIQNNQCH